MTHGSNDRYHSLSFEVLRSRDRSSSRPPHPRRRSARSVRKCYAQSSLWGRFREFVFEILRSLSVACVNVFSGDRVFDGPREEGATVRWASGFPTGAHFLPQL